MIARQLPSAEGLKRTSDKADADALGTMRLLGFFVGQAMRQSGGNANPTLVSQLVQERLGG